MRPAGLREFRRPRLWLAAWIAMLLLTLLVCLAPLPPVEAPLSHFDKLEHGVGYALLAAYAAMLFAPRRGIALAALGLVGYGLLIEALQSLLPWRGLDPLDALANAAGVGLGTLVAATPLARTLQWLDRCWR